MPKELKTTPAQARARDKWNEKNKEIRKKYNAKSSCKRYIRDFIENQEELEEVESWIEEKRQKF